MEIIQYSNGPEGAENPSEQRSNGIQMPDNDSYQKSLYIAAIQEAYGYVGLAGPVAVSCDGVAYTFDFYHPEEKRLIKMFRHEDLLELEMYIQYPGRKIIMVDAEGCEFRMVETGSELKPRLCIPERIGRPVANLEDGGLYFDQRLWKPDKEFKRAVNFNQMVFRVERTAGSGAWSVWRPLSIYDLEEAEIE